ncbi:Chloride channel [Theobroma cacao]|nr:Chloride channel [Theobroma cacao]
MSDNAPPDQNQDHESLTIPLLSHERSLNSTSQVAIVGANVCPIESFDYEIAENDFFKQDWRTRAKIQIFQYIFMKWLLCFLIGAIVSLVGFCNNLAVENIAGIKFVVTSNMMLARRYGMAFLVFSLSNLVLTLFAAIITAFISPAAAGSGIPEVKAYLNGVDAPGIFSLRTLIVKIVGSISAVSSSLLVGKAGPMVHTGACIASLLGQGGSRRYGLTWKWLCFFKNDRDRRDLVTCGSAAGIAAAFRAPVGGVLFALEEMAWRSALLWRAFFTTAVVAIILRALIDICLSGKCGLFGKGGLIMFDAYSANVSYHLADVPPVLVLGVIGGILGSLYNSLLDKVLRVYNLINEKSVVYKIFLACSISIFTSCLLFGLPWLASCQPCPLDASEACPTIGRSGNYKKFQCPPGYYNDLASLIFNTNDDAIRNLFSKNTDSEFQKSTMIIFFVTCFFLSIVSYGIVAPAGLFVPVIVTGASYGRFIGMLLGSHTNLNQGLYAVLGAASFLGGSMRMTVSLCVIILELTNNLLLLPLIMMVLLISKTVADAFNGNIYDLIMKAKGFPYLETHAEPYMRQLTVGDVVSGPLQLFHGIEKVGNIVHILKTTRHHGFPVVDEPPHSESPILYGLILRAHLIALLKKRVFLCTPVQIGVDAFRHFSAEDFAKKGLGNVDKIEDIELSDEEKEMFLDLHPFTNASPYTVVETMSLAKALVLFRQVGLRHLLVIPKISNVRSFVMVICLKLDFSFFVCFFTFLPSDLKFLLHFVFFIPKPKAYSALAVLRAPVVGILTRHDFMPEHILGLHPLLIGSRWKRLRLRWPRLLKLF